MKHEDLSKRFTYQPLNFFPRNTYGNVYEILIKSSFSIPKSAYIHKHFLRKKFLTKSIITTYLKAIHSYTKYNPEKEFLGCTQSSMWMNYEYKVWFSALLFDIIGHLKFTERERINDWFRPKRSKKKIINFKLCTLCVTKINSPFFVDACSCNFLVEWIMSFFCIYLAPFLRRRWSFYEYGIIFVDSLNVPLPQ